MAMLAGVSLAGCTSGTALQSRSDDQFIEIEGKRLNYRIAGSGKPLILLHGASGNLRDWTFRRFDELSKRYRVLTFDRPGLGLSDPADDPSLSEQSRLMRKAAEQLGMPQATLVGHSFGGSVALAWALDAPAQCRGLVLVSAPSQVWPGSLGPLYSVANFPGIGYAFSQLVPALASQSRIARALETLYAPQAVPEGYLEHVRAELSTDPQNFRNNAAQVGTLKAQLRGMVPRYGDLQIPIELIHGTADGAVPIEIHSEPFAQTVARANLTRLDGAGHMPHQTHPDVLNAAIDRAT